jgi:beta subunit of N-acylethanolamine-hydrolyzing acid amidase
MSSPPERGSAVTGGVLAPMPSGRRRHKRDGSVAGTDSKKDAAGGGGGGGGPEDDHNDDDTPGPARLSALPTALREGFVPRFVVNLDADPATRWDHIIDVYMEQMHEIDAQLADFSEELGVGSKTTNVLQMFAGAAMRTTPGRQEFQAEIAGIARRSGIDEGRLTMLQLVYEASACCTAFVVPYAEKPEAPIVNAAAAQDAGDGPATGIDASGGSVGSSGASLTSSSTARPDPFAPGYHGKPPVHARTMDWAMDFLRDVTMEVDFQRGGKTVFLATTWPGYVGVFTGMRPGGYSVSINFRISGDSYMKNAKAALMKRAYPTGFLLRRTLTKVGDFTGATARLQSKPLIAPTYFVVTGVHSREATLITRSRDGEASTEHIPQQLEGKGGGLGGLGGSGSGSGQSGGSNRKGPGIGIRRQKSEQLSSSSKRKNRARQEKNRSREAPEGGVASSSLDSSSSSSSPSSGSGSGSNPSSSSSTKTLGESSGSASASAASPHSEAKRRQTKWDMERDGPVVQANADHWTRLAVDDILWSFERVALVRKRIEQNAGAGFRNEEMWAIMSQDPVLNELTVYGTIMCPRYNVYCTRLPHSERGFVHGDSRLAEKFHDGAALGATLQSEQTRLRMCALCFSPFSRAENRKGQCVHPGNWHRGWGDCNKISCAWNLKTRLGSQHWDCCWSTNQEGMCPKSDFHAEAVTAAGRGSQKNSGPARSPSADDDAYLPQHTV